MAKFLNTTLLNEWIPKLVNETVRELVIIVPYIKTSDKMYNCLFEANKRGVETTLVYRENKLTDIEKTKFQNLDNLNLMHHPNIHAKCYYNEKYLIITSMNMYEYSEINNREMGILLHKEEIENSKNTWNNSIDDIQIFNDAIQEIREIINGAELEKPSRETIDEGFEMNIIKTEKELISEECVLLSKLFGHKKIEPIELSRGYFPICKNYFDKIDVIFDRRIEVVLNHSDNKLQDIYNKFTKQYNEFMIENFKTYWKHHKAPIYLYQNSRSKVWNDNNTNSDIILLHKNGIDSLIAKLKRYI